MEECPTSTPRMRGRPKKPPPPSVMLVDAIDPDQIQGLTQQIRGVFPRLTEGAIDQLTRLVAEATGDYRAALQLEKHWKGHKTKKPSVALPVLIADCGRAYEAATGKKLTSWSSINCKGRWVESASFRLTRLAHGCATGETLSQDLRRQAAKAVRTIFQAI